MHRFFRISFLFQHYARHVGMFGMLSILGLGCMHPWHHGRRHHGHHGEGKACEENAKLPKAHAHLQPLAQAGITGHILMIEKPEGVRVKGRIKGLKPNSVHGIHVHEKGDCSAPDGASAGPHFAAKGHDVHGAPDVADSHLGDLGNVTADAQGVAHIDVLKAGATLGANADTSFLNRSVILHDVADDLTSQPAGASGARVACGMIEAKKCDCEHGK